MLRVRLVTYNVHGCVGGDGRISPVRVAEALAPFEPDIVALQELDVSRSRSRRENQPAIIAETLRMEAHFSPALAVGDERYGNAILSRLPIRLQQTGPLPVRGLSEPRGAMWATVQIGSLEVQIINTHLGLSRQERVEQAVALLGERWAGHPGFAGPSIVCGDLNALPVSGAYKLLGARLRDAQQQPVGARVQSTFPARWPAFRIDHIFVDASTRVEETRVLSTPLTRVASDHLPLMATLVFPQ